MTVYLNQLERDWYARHLTGVTPQTPIGQIKRRYWISQVGASGSNRGFDDLETAWLNKVVSDGGGDPDTTSDLWMEAVISLGKTPSKYLNQNKIIFFQNAS
jgi:hypothetical protein